MLVPRGIAMTVFLLILAGCGSGKNLDPSPQPKRPSQSDGGGGLMLQTAQLQFTTRDEDGQQELVRGTMVLPWPLQEGQIVRGSWESRYVGPRTTTGPSFGINQLGPQVGRGSLTAQRSENEIRVNLNPNMNDNNVELIGTLDRDGNLSGRWEYSTFVGVAAAGPFSAKPQP